MHFSTSTVLATLAVFGTAAQAANVVKQHVVYSATGAADVVGNGFGCVHIRPAGQNVQLGCVKHVFTDGFTVGILDEKTKVRTTCAIKGTSGTCSPAGVKVTVDLTGGTGKVPPPTGPNGGTNFTPEQLVNLPIKGARRLTRAERWARGLVHLESEVEE